MLKPLLRVGLKNLNKNILVKIFIGVFASVCSVSIFAYAKEKLTVVTEDWPPYNYLSAEGEVVGKSTEIIKKTLQAANIGYTLNIYPWARAYKMALEQPNVLIYTAFKIKERAKLFQWVCLLDSINYSIYIFKLTNRVDISIDKFSDLKKYKLGVSRAVFMNQMLKENGFVEGKNYYITRDNLVNVRLLLQGRVDVIFGNKENIDISLKKLNVATASLLSIYNLAQHEMSQTCMAFSLKTPKALVEKVRSSYQKLYLNN